MIRGSRLLWAFAVLLLAAAGPLAAQGPAAGSRAKGDQQRE